MDLEISVKPFGTLIVDIPKLFTKLLSSSCATVGIDIINFSIYRNFTVLCLKVRKNIATTIAILVVKVEQSLNRNFTGAKHCMNLSS
jgi:hypothetical protein